MTKFTKDGLTIETSVATEAAELRRDGFIEQKAKAAPVREAAAAKTESK